MKARRTGLDGSQRRRIYLFRHGAVDYVDKDGNIVPDPDGVALNEKGRAQATAMHELFQGVTVDRALCSGLRRTQETASRVLGQRKLNIEIQSEFEEIRPARGEAAYDLSRIRNRNGRALRPRAHRDYILGLATIRSIIGLGRIVLS